MTQSEKNVAALCENSFLSFWSFPSPLGKKGKELCDLLVICEPDIIIFSVKDISIAPSGDFDLDSDRWLNRAIDGSVDQIYGAERIIQLKEDIFLSDKVTQIKLPDKEIRKIYRVAVAFGRGEKFPLKFGNFGKGFVHVFDEKSINIILSELDTLTDFTSFLDAKEKYICTGTLQIGFSGEDYLALHLQIGFDNLHKSHDALILADDLWTGYSESEEYALEKQNNQISYIWDGIIKTMYHDFINGNLLMDTSREEMELMLRQMNRENRFSRRQLSTCFNEILTNDAKDRRHNARIVRSLIDNNVAYLFLTRPYEMRSQRTKEMIIRCFVAKSLFPEVDKIIGIATEKKTKTTGGSSLDLTYHHYPSWNETFQAQAQTIQDELGYFKSPNRIIIKPDGTRHSN
jgi:hypothetical protein